MLELPSVHTAGPPTCPPWRSLGLVALMRAVVSVIPYPCITGQLKQLTEVSLERKEKYILKNSCTVGDKGADPERIRRTRPPSRLASLLKTMLFQMLAVSPEKWISLFVLLSPTWRFDAGQLWRISIVKHSLLYEGTLANLRVDFIIESIEDARRSNQNCGFQGLDIFEETLYVASPVSNGTTIRKSSKANDHFEDVGQGEVRQVNVIGGESYITPNEVSGNHKIAHISTAVKEDTMLVFEIITPFGTPVVPLVYIIMNKSSGSATTCSLGLFSPSFKTASKGHNLTPCFSASLVNSGVTGSNETMFWREERSDANN